MILKQWQIIKVVCTSTQYNNNNLNNERRQSQLEF